MFYVNINIFGGSKIAKDTFLTPTQIKILELRSRGYTQSKIAGMLGTTRANISITERRAKENIERARKTLHVFEKIGAPLRIEILPGTDIFDVPKRVFAKASNYNLKVKEDSLSLIEKIKRHANEKLKGRNAIERFEIVILSDGRVVIG
jgi:hypothetical protein